MISIQWHFGYLKIYKSGCCFTSFSKFRCSPIYQTYQTNQVRAEASPNDMKEVENYVKEEERQQNNIELIASENVVSKAVMAAQGTLLTNKYAEGYPGLIREIRTVDHVNPSKPPAECPPVSLLRAMAREFSSSEEPF